MSQTNDPTKETEMTQPRRLAVELTDQASEALDEQMATEEMNASTVVSRALQVYRTVMQANQIVIDGKLTKVI